MADEYGDPTTRDEVIEKLLTPFVRADGSTGGNYDRYDPKLVEHLVDRMLTVETDYAGITTVLCPGMVYDRILEEGYCIKLDYYVAAIHVCGWIDREGNFWSCPWAGHERLVSFLAADEYGPVGQISAIEELGWVRISRSKIQNTMRMNEKQRRVIKKLGLEHQIDNAAEMMKKFPKGER